MSSKEIPSTLPNSQADNDEIARYAELLDSLQAGLIVYTVDGSVFLVNKAAQKLLGDRAPEWRDTSGQIIAHNDHPLTLALQTSRPVFDHRLMLCQNQEHSTELSVNALPVFAKDGTVRQILLTLIDAIRTPADKHNTELHSTHDPLTGAFKKNHVMYLLENEIHRARRYGTPFTLALLDIDQFEELCSKHSKEAGAAVLADLGKLLIESMREIDIVGLFGPDEFLLVLPNVQMKDAMIGLERLRTVIESHAFSEHKLQITVSGGITEYTGENSSALIDRTQTLMLHARNSGRNRFCLDMDLL